MKVGKEELLGILAAVEWSLAQDEPALIAAYEAIVRDWIAGLQSIAGVTATRGYPNEAGQPFGRAIVQIDSAHPLTRDQIVQALLAGDPAVAVGVVDDDCIALNPQTLEPGEAELVLAAVRHVLCDS
jgi:L-seryl-tRNA(Ser) seleniumtransferase